MKPTIALCVARKLAFDAISFPFRKLHGLAADQGRLLFRCGSMKEEAGLAERAAVMVMSALHILMSLGGLAYGIGTGWLLFDAPVVGLVAGLIMACLAPMLVSAAILLCALVVMLATEAVEKVGGHIRAVARQCEAASAR